MRVAPGQSSLSISAVHSVSEIRRLLFRVTSRCIHSQECVVVSSLREVLEGCSCELRTKCVLFNYERKFYTERK